MLFVMAAMEVVWENLIRSSCRDGKKVFPDNNQASSLIKWIENSAFITLSLGNIRG